MSEKFKHWRDVATFGESKSFTCGHCGHDISSNKGYGCDSGDVILICHQCSRPTYFQTGGKRTPGSIYGRTVEGIDDPGVAAMYEEARKAVQAGAPTASVLTCRKLLMHIAVAKGAAENEKFLFYVNYLCDKGYVPPDARGWVDLIREVGNEANHEIKIMTETAAKELIDFSEMLLKMIFEFPATVKRKKKTAGTT